MLETYFVKPQTVDRIRACWIGAEIERYAGWLSGRGYSTRTVPRRVPVLVAFGELAWMRGAVVGEALVDYLRHGRRPSGDRHVFFRAVAPVRPVSRVAVSACAKHYLLKAGIQVPRPGSHTPAAHLRSAAGGRRVGVQGDR
jgi:hypothetical protein